VRLSEIGHAGAFGHVLADQAVGVFIGAALPRVMWSGEVKRRAGGLFDGGVVMEFGAVVSGDAFELLRMPTHESQRSVIGVFLRSSSELADHDVAGFALDDREEAVLIALADHRVDLPVTDLAAQLGGERPLADVFLAGETAAAVVSAVAFTTSLASAAKTRVERAAEDAISPDVTVDRLVADGERAAQPAADLLGAPQFTKLRIDAS